MASNKKELDELGLGSDSEEDEQEEEQAVPPPPADETSPSAAAATEAKGGLEAAIEASIPGMHRPQVRHRFLLLTSLLSSLTHPSIVTMFPSHFFTQSLPCPREA